MTARDDIDGPLVAGAAVFGVGWGLGGFCPGPAVAALAWGSSDALLFVVAMAIGMAGVNAWRARASTPQPHRAART